MSVQKARKRSTGNLLQDLVSAVVIVKKCNFPTTTNRIQIQADLRSPQRNSCSICASNNNSVHPITPTENSILDELVLHRSNLETLNTLVFQVCQPCSQTLSKLSKWKRQIYETSLCIRTLIKMQMGEIGQVSQEANTDQENPYLDDIPILAASFPDEICPLPELKFETEDDDMKCFAEDVEISPEMDTAITFECKSDDSNTELKPVTNLDIDNNLEPVIISAPSPSSPVVVSPPCVETSRPQRASRARAVDLLRAMLLTKAQERDDDEVNTSEEEEENESSCSEIEEMSSNSSSTDSQDNDLESLDDSSWSGSNTPRQKEKKTPNWCEICNLSFLSKQALDIHVQTKWHKIGIKCRKISKDGTATFICELGKCRERFETRRDLQDHQKTHKRCDLCSKEFGTLHSYQEHQLTPSHMSKLSEEEVKKLLENKRKYTCKICNRIFWTRKVFRKHGLAHSRPFVCETCGKQCSDISLLKQHQQTHVEKPKVVRKKANRLVAQQDMPMKCKQCERRFADKSGLYRHLATVHKGFRYKCEPCGKEYRTARGLKCHMSSVHEKTPAKKLSRTSLVRSKCEFCDRSYTKKAKLIVHIELNHLPEIEKCPYGCGCTTKFATREEWASHLEECPSDKLTEEAKIRCHFCGQVFRCHLLKLDHHLQNHKVFPCEFCNRSFTASKTLEIHKLCHEESKPFLCSKCGKRFRQPINLQYHSTTVCGENEEAKKELLIKRRELHRIYREKSKPHGCDQCSKRFIEARKLDDHKKKVHPR